jgi:hypothetical protein
MTATTRLKIQTACFVVLAIWTAVEAIRTHTNEFVLISCMVAFVVLALNNWKVIRREQEREKASRWD